MIFSQSRMMAKTWRPALEIIITCTVATLAKCPPTFASKGAFCGTDPGVLIPANVAHDCILL